MLPPDTTISDVPGIGPVTALRLAEAEIATYGDLAAVGAVEAFARMRFRHGRQVTRNALHALDAAIQGIPWTELPQSRKTELDAAAAERLTITEGRRGI